jgi:hypothetical protein
MFVILRAIRTLAMPLLAIAVCMGAMNRAALAQATAPKAAPVTTAGPSHPNMDAQGAEDRAIASSLAAMLRAGRTVISNNQDRINDPAIGDKGLDGKTVLALAIPLYTKATGTDPLQTDPASRLGRLQRAQMDAIVEVVDANQVVLNAPGTGFKGFIPAVFGRLVSEAFVRRAAGEAEMKITAPVDLVRNRRALPDPWEAAVIKGKFLKSDWPKGQAFADTSELRGHPAFRIAVPEYYAVSCLSCHGQPKGSPDLTGYPREGAAEGDLGGVISIVLIH